MGYLYKRPKLRRRGMHIGFCWESQEERDHLKDVDIGGRIILKRIFERQDGVVWTGQIWLRIGSTGKVF
jgi:hypothetical protein